MEGKREKEDRYIEDNKHFYTFIINQNNYYNRRKISFSYLYEIKTTLKYTKNAHF